MLRLDERGQLQPDLADSWEVSPDGFSILRPVRDGSGRVVDFSWVYENGTIARLNGTDPRVVVGRRLSEFLPSHAASKFHEAYRRVAETGKSEVLEERYEGDSVPRPAWFRVAVVSMGPDIAVLAPPFFLLNATAANVERLYLEVIRQSPLPLGIYDRGALSPVQVPLFSS